MQKPPNPIPKKPTPTIFPGSSIPPRPMTGYGLQRNIPTLGTPDTGNPDSLYENLPSAEHLPKEVQDRAHQHVLFLTSAKHYDVGPGYMCDKCKKNGTGVSYHCEPCSFDLHPECVIDSEGRTLKTALKEEDTKSVVKLQALYRGHSMRKLQVGTTEKTSMAKYMDRERAKHHASVILLGTRNLSKNVAEIILDYANQVTVQLEGLNRVWPLQFKIGDETFSASFVHHTRLNGEQCQRELAKLLALRPAAVQLVHAGKEQWEGPDGRPYDQPNIPLAPGQEAKLTPVGAEDIVIKGVVMPRPIMYCMGRPFTIGEGPALTAGIRSSGEMSKQDLVSLKEEKVLVRQDTKTIEGGSSVSDWSSGLPGLTTKAPNMDGLSWAQRTHLSQLWANDGLAEHASIASFARFTLQLMSVGAPAHLLMAAQRAAADEVRHAKIAFSLAAAYAGKPVEPGSFPVNSSLELETDLASVAASAAAEGCVEETLSCLIMAEACQRCEDPVVRTCMTSVVKDEARHAALAWQTVAWAVKTGGKTVHAAVSAALSKTIGKDQSCNGYERYGRLDSKNALGIRAAASKEVIAHFAEAVLAGNQVTMPSLEKLSSFTGSAQAVTALVGAMTKD